MTTFFFLLIGVSMVFGLWQLALTGELLGRWIGHGGLDVPDHVAPDDPVETRQHHNEEIRQLLDAVKRPEPLGVGDSGSEVEAMILGELAALSDCSKTEGASHESV